MAVIEEQTESARHAFSDEELDAYLGELSEDELQALREKYPWTYRKPECEGDRMLREFRGVHGGDC